MNILIIRFCFENIKSNNRIKNVPKTNMLQFFLNNSYQLFIDNFYFMP